MILALVKAINNFSSLDLSQQTSGQRSPLSVYAYAVSKTLCQPRIRPLLLQARKMTDGNFSSHPPQYLFGICPRGTHS